MEFVFTHNKLPSSSVITITLFVIYSHDELYGLMPEAYTHIFPNYHTCSCSPKPSYVIVVQLFDFQTYSTCLDSNFETNSIFLDLDDVVVNFDISEEFFNNIVKVQRFFNGYVVEEIHIKALDCCNYITP